MPRSAAPPKASARKAPLRKRADDAAPAREPGVRERAAQATREAILKAATQIFAKHGYDGGRVEAISQAARSYDRMIYYYFGSKEGLFIAVLEDAYRRFNEAESALVIDEARPLDSLKAMIRFIWHYYQKNPEFITLLNTENLHRGRHIRKSLRAADYSSPALAVVQRVLDAGAAKKLFRTDISARDVYLMTAAMGYFYLSNRFTLSAFLGEALDSAAALAHWEQFLVDAVLRTVARSGRPT